MRGARCNGRQYGGRLGVLLALVIAGMVVYWALRITMQPVSAEGQQTHCEERIAELVTADGAGAEAAAALDELPAECQRLLSDRASRTRSPQAHAQSL